VRAPGARLASASQNRVVKKSSRPSAAAGCELCLPPGIDAP